jgi:hypothetical protein
VSFLFAAQVASGRDSVTDIYSTGKSMFLAMIMVVTCEIGLLARFWTTPFVIICFLSYALVGCVSRWCFPLASLRRCAYVCRATPTGAPGLFLPLKHQI